MRLVPASRLYQCSACASKFLVLMPAVDAAFKSSKITKTLPVFVITIVAVYGVFHFRSEKADHQEPAKPLHETKAPESVAIVPPARHESNISQGDLEAAFTWDQDPTVTAYNIYWLETPGVTKINGHKIPNVASPHTVKGLQKGNTYYFVITAVDGQFESDESDEISLTAGE